MDKIKVADFATFHFDWVYMLGYLAPGTGSTPS